MKSFYEYAICITHSMNQALHNIARFYTVKIIVKLPSLTAQIYHN